MAEYEIRGGNAVPVGGLARSIHATVLELVGRTARAELVPAGVLDDPIGEVTLGAGFEGPDPAGWYRGTARMHLADGVKVEVVDRPVTALNAPTGLVPIEVAIDESGRVRFRVDGRTSEDLPPFRLSAFRLALAADRGARP